jgi:CheY-like chemotaxis protein
MAAEPGALDGRHILVVEDDFMVASVLSDMLEDAGAVVLGPFSHVRDAIDFIERNETPLDGAVLDVNLHGESSYPIADLLIARGIRFVFATGYDAIAAAYHAYPRCQKPFQEAALLAALG